MPSLLRWGGKMAQCHPLQIKKKHSPCNTIDLKFWNSVCTAHVSFQASGIPGESPPYWIWKDLCSVKWIAQIKMKWNSKTVCKTISMVGQFTKFAVEIFNFKKDCVKNCGVCEVVFFVASEKKSSWNKANLDKHVLKQYLFLGRKWYQL